jgi:hypothetical protein
MDRSAESRVTYRSSSDSQAVRERKNGRRDYRLARPQYPGQGSGPGNRQKASGPADSLRTRPARPVARTPQTEPDIRHT